MNTERLSERRRRRKREVKGKEGNVTGGQRWMAWKEKEK